MIKLYNILEINQNSIYCATLCNLNNIKEVIDKNGQINVVWWKFCDGFM